jgi:hypothetical protein
MKMYWIDGMKPLKLTTGYLTKVPAFLALPVHAEKSIFSGYFNEAVGEAAKFPRGLVLAHVNGQPSARKVQWVNEEECENAGETAGKQIA